MKRNIIKLLAALLITYLGAAFITWDFEWYLRLGVITSYERVFVLILGIAVMALIYLALSIIELEF